VTRTPPDADAVDGRLADGLDPTPAVDVAASIDPGATLAVSGFGSVGDPKAVPRALAAREDAATLDLTVVSGGSVGPAIDDAMVGAGAVARRYPFVAQPAAREAIDGGRVAFHDRHIAGLGDEVRYGALADPDVAVVEAVAAGEGWFVPTTSVGPVPAYVAAADEVVVEVNDAQPLALADLHDVHVRGRPPGRDPLPLDGPGDRVGGPAVTFDPDKLRAVVRTDRRDDPYSFRDPTAADRAIADGLADLLRREVGRDPRFSDELVCQFGVGSLGNALMGALADADLGVPLTYFGEVVQDGLLDLLDDGELTAASATSLALSADGQDRLFDDVERYADDLVVRPAAVSNSPALIDRFGVVAVNGAVEVDLHGHVNSTHVDGRRLVSGIGGSGDFARAAALAVAALPSTAAGGERSRIVPVATHVDHTEHDVDVVITEHGVADLRGLSPRERSAALVDCAHPRFRDDLRAYRERALDGGGASPADFGAAFDWRSG
jgi:succinyl-CoA:acetate CoA-transferase